VKIEMAVDNDVSGHVFEAITKTERILTSETNSDAL
jgi:hypothetical protein